MPRRGGSQNAGFGRSWKADTPCQSGNDCKDLSCSFSHSKAVCTKGDTCSFAGCVYRHGWSRKRECLSGKGCQNSTCAFLHPRGWEVCRYAERCTDHACTRVHPKGRRLCSSECRALACTAVHPRGRIPSCPLGELCVALACLNLHPASRAPPCEAGEGCADAMCSRLHAVRGLELVLSKTACPLDAKGVRARILFARRAHEAKLAAARAKVFKLHQLQGVGAGEEQGLELVRELSQQLESFDAAVAPIWAALCDQATARASPAKSGGGGGAGALHQHVSREVFRLEMALPVLSARARFEALVGSAGRFLVVKGSTGSGKSTQLPQYLADMAMFAGLKILVTEPRKVAAMTLAARVALEWSAGEHAPPCGRAAVGYRAGGASSAGARIEFVTEGNFLAQLIRQSKGDGVLDGVGAVVLDEAHERSVKSDLILGALRSLPGLQHLRVVVASATMDTALFSTFLGGAPVIDVPGRVFPVDVVYRPTRSKLQNLNPKP